METIREKGYHHWNGQLNQKQSYFWPITRTGIKLAFQRKYFKFLFSSSFLPAVMYAAGIYIAERLEDFKFMTQGAERTIQVNPGFFKSYLTLDFLFFMIILLMSLGGAGLISDDFRHKAVQLYFARPITRLDYILGKAGVVVFFVGLLTLVPGLVLFILKLLFSGSFKFFLQYPWLIFSITGYSLFLMIFFTAFVLLLSSLSKNRRYVSVIIFVLYIISDITQGVIYLIFRTPYAALFSFKANLKQVAAAFFLEKMPYPYPWYLSFLVLIIFCFFSYLVIKNKVRGVEVIR